MELIRKLFQSLTSYATLIPQSVGRAGQASNVNTTVAEGVRRTTFQPPRAASLRLAGGPGHC